MLSREKRRVLTGGLILITLVFLICSTACRPQLSTELAILCLVVALGTLLQNARDKGGWFIALIGVLFLIKENWYRQLGEYTNYAVPLILIVIGVYVLIKKR